MSLPNSEEIKIIMKSTLADVGDIIVDNIRIRTPVAITGLARNSINWELKDQGTVLKLIIGSNLVYIRALEFGRRPGSMPPVKAIQEWLEFKRVENAEQVAWAVAISIRDKGTKPARMFQKGIAASINPLKNIIKKGIRDILKFSKP